MKEDWIKVFEQLEKDKEKILIQKVGKKIIKKDESVFFLGNLRIVLRLDDKPLFEFYG